MGVAASVPSAKSSSQITTSPARASTPDLADRIFSLIVFPTTWSARLGQHGLERVTRALDVTHANVAHVPYPNAQPIVDAKPFGDEDAPLLETIPQASGRHVARCSQR